MKSLRFFYVLVFVNFLGFQVVKNVTFDSIQSLFIFFPFMYFFHFGFMQYIHAYLDFFVLISFDCLFDGF